MIDKEEATRLRKDGFSYGEIAKRVGCSKAWCALNLKDVPRGKSADRLSGDDLRISTLKILDSAMQEIRALR